MIEFVKPTLEMIEIIAQDMRESDVIEVMASHGHAPLEALVFSFEQSEYSTIATHNDVPFVMFGVTVLSDLTGLGCPWLLSSNEVFNHVYSFLKMGPIVISDMISVYPRLMNYVHNENRTSVEWLRSLGFTIEDPEPYGVKGDLFHKFHMGVI